MYIKLWAMLFCFSETTVAANDPSKETFVASHFVDVVSSKIPACCLKLGLARFVMAEIDSI